MLLLCVYQAREKALSTPTRLAISGLIGGGMGNLVDRILFGGVTDYIRLSLIRFPIFNFADICITVSVAALMLLLLLTISTTKRRNVMGESENIELIVDPSLSGMRLDAYLREQTPFSRSRIASLMEEGALLVNSEVERKAARKTEGGMRLCWSCRRRNLSISCRRISRWIFFIRTPTSLLSTKKRHGRPSRRGNESGTLVNALLYHVHDLSGIGGRNAAGNRPSAGQGHLRPDFDCENDDGPRLAQRAIQKRARWKSITAPLRTVPFSQGRGAN